MTITLLRAAKPVKAMGQLKESGYRVTNPYPGIYYISGMVDIKMQIVVTGQLAGDEFVPLRIQKRNAAREDFIKFAEGMRSVYTESESDYVETVVKYGIYDRRNELVDLAKEDTDMYDELMELFKPDIDKAVAKGRAEGKAEGEAERKKLEDRIKKLEAELKKAKVAAL